MSEFIPTFKFIENRKSEGNTETKQRFIFAICFSMYLGFNRPAYNSKLNAKTFKCFY